MKPGIPWSVKGIEQQARQAAKQAARQSGMTIGEWLNTVILDSAEGGDDLERRYRRPPYRPKPLPGAEHGEGEEVTLRLEEIAEQLHTIARHESDTAVSRHLGPDEDAVLQGILERLDAHEQHTTTALGSMQERLDEVAQRLGAGHTAPQRADDVPGYRALEGALRNIIEHIEISETRTRDTIRSLQERLSETLEHTGSETAEPNDLAEVRDAEQRLRSLVEEAKQAGRWIDGVSQHDIDQLRLEIEQLATTVSQSSSHAATDLGDRMQRLEADLKRQIGEVDQGTQREVAALAERMAATEKRLEHLATIEESVAQLARSLEAGDGDAGRGSGASPELKALEEGLDAVRASAEMSDRRTQETLHAVHETLEQIVGKLTELEADDGPEDEAADGETSQALAEEIASELEDEATAGAAEEAVEEPADEETAFLDPESESEVAAGESETDETSEMESEGFVFPEDPNLDDSEPDSSDEPQMQAAEETLHDTYGPAETGDAPVREDYIAAARRAAQMAATRNSGFNRFSQRLSGGGAKEDTTGNGSAQKKRGFLSSLLGGMRGRKAKAGDDDQPDSKKGKRKRLIFAGLVLLAAASAYGAQRHAGSLPSFDGLDASFLSPRAGLLQDATPRASQETPAAPATRRAANAHEALTTASIARPAPRAAARPAAVSEMLPVEIGPESLRQAAVRGDATAQFVVAGRYLEGKAVAKDEKQAAQWYRRAAEQGLAAAQYRLGSMYEHGWGMPADRRQAKALYEQAAARGNVNAMHNLAVLHTDASTGPRSYELAAKWFRKAAERGLKDSQYNLAVMNEQGLGLSKNPQEAVFWYSLAAVQGDREAAAKAKALEASLAPETAKNVRARLLSWNPLPADRNANVVPVADPSWQGTS
jgi:localization factor PodJL